MLLIIATARGGDALAAPLCSWSAAQLLDPVLLLTPGADGALTSRAIRRGEAVDVSVVDALRHVDLESVVPITVAIGSELENADDVVAAHYLATALLEQVIGADSWRSPALVAVPDAPGRHCNVDLLLPAFDPWIVVAAEDRVHPAGVNTLIELDDDHLARHAAHALVSLGNAWSFTPNDADNYIDSARARGAATVGATDLVRCYTRLIDAGYLADHVAAQVLRPGVRWPNPDVDDFDDVDLEDDQNQAIADEFLEVHAPTLGLTEILPLVHKRTKLSLWEAIKAVFRFLVDRLRRLPAQWLDDRIGKLYNTVAERVEGMGSDVKVRRWREREPGEPPGDLLDELAARRLKVEPGAVGPTWEDMWRLSIGLVDGSAMPSSLDLPFLMSGQRRILETDPRLIVPDPEDRPPGARDRAQYRACDPKRFDPVVSSAFLAEQDDGDNDGNPEMGAWYKPRSRALLWRIGVGIAQALNQAEREKERPSTEDWDDLEELAAEVDEKTSKFRRRYFVWLLVRTVLAIAASFALVFSDIPAWAQLAGPPVVWMLWLYLLGKGWQRANRRVKAIEDRAAERSEELLHQLFLALVREADFERLGWRYDEYLDWAEIIGWYLHRPFVGREGEDLDVAEALDPASLPAAFGAGLGDVGLETFDTICQASRARLFLSSWLRTYYESVRDGLVEDWQEKKGHDSEQTRPTGFADNTRGAASLRRHLVAEARKGTGRRLGDNPMSPALLDQISDRPLTKLIDGVALVSDGHDQWLPPVGAWLTDSTNLALVAETIQPTVVRIRVERDDDMAGASGFVLRSTGLVVTNAHVVEGAEKLEVAVEGGEWLAGLVRATASETDLALVDIVTSVDLPVVRLGTSSDLSIGTRLFTVGFPKLLDGDPTFASGEITASHRFVAYGAGQMEVVQASYPATGGASGSPVFDSSGAVIGIHQGGAEAEDDQRAADYMSFAVPVDALRRWLAEIGELTSDAFPQPLRTRPASEVGAALQDPQGFLDEIADAVGGTLNREHGGEAAAFKSLSITDRTSIGWDNTATIQFLTPFRTGGSVVQATAPLPVSPRDIENGDEGEGSDPSNDLV